MNTTTTPIEEQQKDTKKKPKHEKNTYHSTMWFDVRCSSGFYGKIVFNEKRIRNYKIENWERNNRESILYIRLLRIWISLRRSKGFIFLNQIKITTLETDHLIKHAKTSVRTFLIYDPISSISSIDDHAIVFRRSFADPFLFLKRHLFNSMHIYIKEDQLPIQINLLYYSNNFQKFNHTVCMHIHKTSNI